MSSWRRDGYVVLMAIGAGCVAYTEHLIATLPRLSKALMVIGAGCVAYWFMWLIWLLP